MGAVRSECNIKHLKFKAKNKTASALAVWGGVSCPYAENSSKWKQKRIGAHAHSGTAPVWTSSKYPSRLPLPACNSEHCRNRLSVVSRNKNATSTVMLAALHSHYIHTKHTFICSQIYENESESKVLANFDLHFYSFICFDVKSLKYSCIQADFKSRNFFKFYSLPNVILLYK